MCVWCCWGTETLSSKSNGAVPHQLPQCRSIYAKLSWQSLLSINTTLLEQRFISFWTITIDGPSLHRLHPFFFFFNFSTLSSVHILHGDNGIFLFFFAVFMVRVVAIWICSWSAVGWWRWQPFERCTVLVKERTDCSFRHTAEGNKWL